jgi:hypothetical protein
MTDPGLAIFEPYRVGLRKLARELGQHSPTSLVMRTLEQRLLENIRFGGISGDTPTLKAERSAIIYELNALALEELGSSFNDLCDEAGAGGVSLALNPTKTGLTLSAAPADNRGWARHTELATRYTARLKQFLTHVGKRQYEEAQHVYWELIYFVGTREFWDDCRLLSRRLLVLSDRERDFHMKGMVLVTGQVWPLLVNKKLTRAKVVLTDALRYLEADRHGAGLAVFYEYMADIEEASGDLDAALVQYREAINRAVGLDQHKLRLKMWFAEVKAEPLSSRSRLVALHLLANAFQEVQSYREGMVLIEVARTLHALRSIESLEAAQRAYALLHDQIMMPSNAGKAASVLNAIVEESSVSELRSSLRKPQTGTTGLQKGRHIA